MTINQDRHAHEGDEHVWAVMKFGQPIALELTAVTATAASLQF